MPAVGRYALALASRSFPPISGTSHVPLMSSSASSSPELSRTNPGNRAVTIPFSWTCPTSDARRSPFGLTATGKRAETGSWKFARAWPYPAMVRERAPSSVSPAQTHEAFADVKIRFSSPSGLSWCNLPPENTASPASSKRCPGSMIPFARPLMLPFKSGFTGEPGFEQRQVKPAKFRR